jgi:hypothetical protein
VAQPQSFQRHSRYVPGYHYALSGIFLINLIYRVMMLLRYPAVATAVPALTAFGLALALWYMRVFPLRVQDRVIRLEEQLRMQRLLPADLQARIHEFSPGQLVALRFASDAEIPALARRVLDEKLVRKHEIKALIQTWRPDELRA